MAPPSYQELLARYRKAHGHFVKPKQGWGSLAEELYLAYSMSMVRGWYDVGTFVNKPGDHGGHPQGKPPAWAFDIRRKGWVGRWGWGWLQARLWAQYLWDNHRALNIDYVIRGRSVISRERPFWHPLTTGDTSHDWHIHVSGYDPDWEV